MFLCHLVGGGSAFASTTQSVSGVQAIAAGLVPAGLTPVAFFPPSPTQQLQALSVIFLETPIKKRKKRHSEARYVDDTYYHNALPHSSGVFYLYIAEELSSQCSEDGFYKICLKIFSFQAIGAGLTILLHCSKYLIITNEIYVDLPR